MRRKKSRVPTWKRSRTVPEKLTFLEVTSIVDLPELALINIFKYLSLNEVENCYLACPKWKNIIGLDFFQPHLRLVSSLHFEMKKSFYLTGWTEDTQNVELILKIWKEFRPFRDKLLITTGTSMPNQPPPHLSKNPLSYQQQNTQTEIIDLSYNPNLKNEIISNDFNRYGCMGAVFNGKPVICGGYQSYHKYFKDCHIIGESGNPPKLLSRRAFGASVLIDHNTLWIVGGWSRDFNDLSSTELLSFKSDQPPIMGPELPFTIRCHCMIRYDENSIYLIGGKQNNEWSKKTWIVNPVNGFEIQEGPPLNHVRHSHACAKLIINNGKILIVVSGGLGSIPHQDYLDSVEILDPSANNPAWLLGPKLPIDLWGHVMETGPTGKSVIVIGGKNESRDIYSKKLFELTDLSKDWVELEQKLENGRHNHLVMAISEETAKYIVNQT